jgi:hypothetical protein
MGDTCSKPKHERVTWAGNIMSRAAMEGGRIGGSRMDWPRTHEQARLLRSLLQHVLLKKLPMIEEAWLVHHLQNHKPRKMEDKDRVGQQYVLIFLHKVYRTLTCKTLEVWNGTC